MVFLLAAMPSAAPHVKLRFEEIIRPKASACSAGAPFPPTIATLGNTARAGEPVVRQVFIGRSVSAGSADLTDEMAFERKLFVIRRLAEQAIRYAPADASASGGDDAFYIASLSCRTIVYKGMLTAVQVDEFYPDLHDPAMASAIALVHSRFSTNTFPSWARAQPFRYMMHNGEINTIRGNQNWMHTRQQAFSSRSCSAMT